MSQTWHASDMTCVIDMTCHSQIFGHPNQFTMTCHVYDASHVWHVSEMTDMTCVNSTSSTSTTSSFTFWTKWMGKLRDGQILKQNEAQNGLIYGILTLDIMAQKAKTLTSYHWVTFFIWIHIYQATFGNRSQLGAHMSSLSKIKPKKG